ncbi:MAG: hypothetical protein H0X30_39190 [Anaerolineae bacterium]|nr:hypothetical protein [Anaerolineae bacterium]
MWVGVRGISAHLNITRCHMAVTNPNGIGMPPPPLPPYHSLVALPTLTTLPT